MKQPTGEGDACLRPASSSPRVALLNMPSPPGAAAACHVAKNRSLIVRGRIGYANRYGAFLKPSRLLQLLQPQQLCEPQQQTTTTILRTTFITAVGSATPETTRRKSPSKRPRLAKPISAFYSSKSGARNRNPNFNLLTPATCASFMLLLACALLFILTQKPLQERGVIAAATAETQQQHKNLQLENKLPPHHLPGHRVFRRHPRNHNHQQQQQQPSPFNDVVHHRHHSQQKREEGGEYLLNELNDSIVSDAPKQQRVSRIEFKSDTDETTAQLDHPVISTIERKNYKPILSQSHHHARLTQVKKRQQQQKHVVNRKNSLGAPETSFADGAGLRRRHVIAKNSRYSTRNGLNLLGRSNKLHPAYELGDGNVFRSRFKQDDVDEDDDNDHLDILSVGDTGDDDEDEEEDGEDEDDDEEDRDDDQEDDDDGELNEIEDDEEEEEDSEEALGYYEAKSRHHRPNHLNGLVNKHRFASKHHGHNSIEVHHHHHNHENLQHLNRPTVKQMMNRVEDHNQFLDRNQQREAPEESPRVPYQTPVVVSISDNSFVSASPLVASTSTTTTATKITTTTSKTPTVAANPAASNSGKAAWELSTPPSDYFNYTYWLEPLEEGSSKLPLTTSTTATTTSGSHHQQQLEGHSFRSGSSGATVEDDKWLVVLDNDKGASAAPVVFSEYKNFPVSDEIASNQMLRLGESTTKQVLMMAPTSSDSSSTSRAASTIATTMQSSNLISGGDNELEEGDALIDDIDLADGDENDDSSEVDLDLDLEFGVKTAAPEKPRRKLAHMQQRQQLDDTINQWQPAEANYANLIVNPPNELPAFGPRRRHWHSAGIQMVQEDPNEYQQQGGLTSAIIAILFGIGATGVLVMIVGAKMRSIRARLAHKSRRRSLVPDTDFLIKTIPI